MMMKKRERHDKHHRMRVKCERGGKLVSKKNMEGKERPNAKDRKTLTR